MSQSINRISQILLLAATRQAPLGVSEISRELSLPKSVVHRAVTSLVEAGLLVQDDRSRYGLGPSAVAIGIAAIGVYDISDAALPVMKSLRDRTNETVTLSLLLGDESVYRAQLESPQEVRMTMQLGSRRPLHSSATGNAMLAELGDDRIAQYLRTAEARGFLPDEQRRASLRRVLRNTKARGYSTSVAGRSTWGAGTASAIRGASGAVVAAVCVCGPRERLPQKRLEEYGPLVHAAAGEISQLLQGAGATTLSRDESDREDREMESVGDDGRSG